MKGCALSYCTSLALVCHQLVFFHLDSQSNKVHLLGAEVEFDNTIDLITKYQHRPREPSYSTTTRHAVPLSPSSKALAPLEIHRRLAAHLPADGTIGSPPRRGGPLVSTMVLHRKDPQTSSSRSARRRWPLGDGRQAADDSLRSHHGERKLRRGPRGFAQVHCVS